MFTNRRWVTVGLGLVAGLALLMMMPSVRAAASEFLGLFRVQKFAPISISPEQLALLSQLEGQNVNPGEFVVVKEPGEPMQMGSLAEAGLLMGYPVLTLPQRAGEPVEVYGTTGGSGYLTINLEGARAILQATNVDPMLLPDSLDGRQVNVTTYDSVQQVWADGLVLMQMASPVVEYPTDVDPAVLGGAMLRVLGVDAAAADDIARSIDWTSTMLLPVPQGMATYSDVTINGQSGVALSAIDGSGNGVIWQSGGMLYMLSGTSPVEQLLDYANELQ